MSPSHFRNYIRSINLLAGARLHPRTGKIARLPAPIREAINRMIEDGLPYKAIIQKLQSSTPPLPYPISEMNLSNWRNGGHQDWLQHQRRDQLLSQYPEAVRQQARIAADALCPLPPR